MTKNSILAKLAAATLVATSATALAQSANPADYITVSAPNEQVIGLTPGTNAPIKLYTATVNVHVGDLDLRAEPGWGELGLRVQTASRMACEILDRRIYPRAVSGTKHCRVQTMREAMRAALHLRTAPRKANSLAFTIGQ